MTDNKRTLPDGVIVASNGAWRDKDTGKYVKGGQPSNMITPETSPEYHRIRQQKKLDGILAANNGLATAFKNQPTSFDAWAHIVESQAKLSTKDDYTSTKAADFVGKATGHLASERSGSDPVPPGALRLELGSGVVEDIFKYIQEYRDTSDKT